MRIGRANDRLVIIAGDGVTDAATASGGEFSADPDQVFAVWDRFTEWAGRPAGPGAHTGPLVVQLLQMQVNGAGAVGNFRIQFRRSFYIIVFCVP